MSTHTNEFQSSGGSPPVDTQKSHLAEGLNARLEVSVDLPEPPADAKKRTNRFKIPSHCSPRPNEQPRSAVPGKPKTVFHFLIEPIRSWKDPISEFQKHDAWPAGERNRDGGKGRT